VGSENLHNRTKVEEDSIILFGGEEFDVDWEIVGAQ
jgi:hypothetical protein